MSDEGDTIARIRFVFFQHGQVRVLSFRLCWAVCGRSKPKGVVEPGGGYSFLVRVMHLGDSGVSSEI